MSKSSNTPGRDKSNRPSSSAVYEIRVMGQLDSTWSDWFDGLEVIPLENGETLISGDIPDQAALQGILAKAHNLNLPLLSVRRVDQEEE